MTSPRQLLAERYRELLEEIYQSCADATPELPLELQLQEWWAAGLLPHQGTTQDGKTLNILDKGRWNRCPGPDFTHAEIELNGVRLRGIGRRMGMGQIPPLTRLCYRSCLPLRRQVGTHAPASTGKCPYSTLRLTPGRPPRMAQLAATMPHCPAADNRWQK